MVSYFIAIDQGTTGTTALLVKVKSEDQSIEVLDKSTSQFPQYYPQSGWVEHDLDEIWNSIVSAVSHVLEKSSIKADDLSGIGITNQRETLCFYDRKSGQSARKAIVWQCRRSANICKELMAEKDWIVEKTGLQLDPYFTASKIKWIAQNEPDLHKKITDGHIVISTIDTWLIHRLTSGESFFTEPSNASRTMLMDLKTCQWDKKLLDIFEVPQGSLPEIKESAGCFGETRGLDFLADGIPILGVLGDQQASLLGQSAVSKGDLKCTFGTGAFLLMNIGDECKLSQHHLITTVAWSIGGKVTYALEGSAFIAGAAVQFARDEMKWFDQAEDSERLASQVSAAPDLYFVPALTGLGAPSWNAEARGAYLGLNRSTTANQMVRATLEGIAFSVGDLVEALSQDAQPIICESMRVDGGASANSVLMQLQSDMTGLRVDRSVHLESTGLGAAFVAMLGAGAVKQVSDFESFRQSAAFYTQNLSADDVNQWKSGWKRAVRAVDIFSKE
ncbi:MAG: FGGY family carbohydrate kinase [Oligoflexales bacterium]